jgi:predicted CopG family antitoxin
MSKQIRLDDDVYEGLDRRRLHRETFSDAVKRLVAVDDSVIVTYNIHAGEKNEQYPPLPAQQ